MLLPFETDIKVQQARIEQMPVVSFIVSLPLDFDTVKSYILQVLRFPHYMILSVEYYI